MNLRFPVRALPGLLCALSLAALSACDEDTSTGPTQDPNGPGNGGPPMGPMIEVVADDLVAPQGIELDAQGRIWVAEQGTGADDSRISVVTPDGTVHPVLEGLPSNIVMGSAEGVHHLALRNGELWGAQGLGEESPDGNLLRIDISGFTPGDPPLTMADVVVEDIGAFVLAEDPTGTGQTNIYNLTFGPGGDLFIVDASANAVILREAGTGALSVLATLPPVPNSTGVGPPMSQAVPTGIVFEGGRLLVTAFPGFPFVVGAGRVYSVDLAGNVTTVQEGLTGAVDLTLDPSGTPVVLEFAAGPMGNFMPNTGGAVRVGVGGLERLVDDLNFPTGIRFAASGEFFVTDFSSGTLLRVTP